MENYIEDKKKLYLAILEFLENPNEEDEGQPNEESFQHLLKIITNQQIEGDQEEMRQFLEIIKSIGNNHHRDQQFNARINRILLHYKKQIKQTLSNSDIFHIFESNKKIVLFLLKNDIITNSASICKEIVNKIENNGLNYCHFFIPEIEKFISEDEIKFIKNELLKKDPNFFDNYEEKRQEGENDSYICSLIRQDSVEEFISYINRFNISPKSKILPSIFETNPFLIDNENTTLIKYSAFFGSIQIFNYLRYEIDLTPSTLLCSIHSHNEEIIYLLESSNCENSTQNYFQCFIESIKCHHIAVANYIENNFLVLDNLESKQKEEIISKCIQYHNYTYFQIDKIVEYGFFYLNYYHYDKLINLLLKKKEKEIEKKIITTSKYF